MSDFSSNLLFPYLQPAQAQKHVTVNESLLRLDALVQGAVESRFVAAQPASPVDGDRYILPPGKTGAGWGPMADGAIAYWRDGVWEQLTPRSGFRVFVRDEARLVVFDAARWRAVEAIGENLLINGAFTVWQRGTSFASVAAGTYVADRWRTGAASMTVARSSDAPAGALYALEADAGSAAWALTQRIEALASAPAVGQRVTLAFWAKSVSGAGALSASLARANAVDNFSATTAVQTVALSDLDGTWRRFTAVFDALPAGAANGIEIAIARGASGAARIALVQLHIGADAPSFPHRAPAAELSLCQRYFEKSYNLATAPGGAPGAGNCTASVGAPSTNAFGTLSFASRKRVAPVYTVFDGSGAPGVVSFYDGAWRNGGATTLLIPSEGGFFVQTNIAGSQLINFEWTANAEL